MSDIRTLNAIIDKLNLSDKNLVGLNKTITNKTIEIENFDKPLSPSKYNEVMDFYDSINSITNVTQNNLLTIQNKVNESFDTIKNTNNLTEKFAIAINNNRTKFGLKGQLKQSIEKELEGQRRKLKATLETVRRYPYAHTPYEPTEIYMGDESRGGKHKKTHKRKRMYKRKSRRTH